VVAWFVDVLENLIISILKEKLLNSSLVLIVIVPGHEAVGNCTIWLLDVWPKAFSLSHTFFSLPIFRRFRKLALKRNISFILLLYWPHIQQSGHGISPLPCDPKL
jgi:hypothetical protein